MKPLSSAPVGGAFGGRTVSALVVVPSIRIGVLDEFDVAVARAPVLEPEDPPLARRTADDVGVAVAVEVDGLGVDRPDHADDLVLDPVAGERVGGGVEPGDRVFLRGLAVRVLRPLVRGDDFRPAVAVEVAGEHPDVGAAVLRHRRDHPWPFAAPQGGRRLFRGGAGVLEVDEVGQLAGGHDVEIAVAVEVGDGDVLGGRGLVPLGEGCQMPHGGVGAAEGEPDVALADVAVLGVRLVDGDDVDVAVAVEVGHLESVTAADRHAADGDVVDDVLAPGDPLAVGGLYAGRRVRDEVRGWGFGGLAGRECHGDGGDEKGRSHGRYQIGDDQARSWIVGGSPGRGSTPARIASQVDQRQVGFSSTRR